MAQRLLHKVFHGATDGGSEQKLSSNTVIKINWLFLFFKTFQKVGRLPVSSILSIVPVEILCVLEI